MQSGGQLKPWKQLKGGLTLPGVFTREKVNPPGRVTLARYRGNASCLVNTTKKKRGNVGVLG